MCHSGNVLDNLGDGESHYDHYRDSEDNHDDKSRIAGEADQQILITINKKNNNNGDKQNDN